MSHSGTAFKHLIFTLLILVAFPLFTLSAEGSAKPQYFDPEIGMEEHDEIDVIETKGIDYDDAPYQKSYKRPFENDSNRNWWHLLKQGKLNTSDTTVQYPKFMNFCMKVYRWADKTFNSYDTTYVEGTGRRWKARILSDNWLDSYYINPGKMLPIRVMSDPYPNIGAYLQYMAVSIGYSVDLLNIFGKHPAKHKKWDYNFNCARFNVEGHYWQNTGGSYIRTFGAYNNGKLIKRYFGGVSLDDIEICGYYFFNNRKYSMGASYNFSKIQRKSAGSAIIGFGYNNIRLGADLNELPAELKPYLNIPIENYRFHYKSYYIVSGYAFNWVLNKRLLFNISAFPGIGVNYSTEDNHSGSAQTFAANIRAMSSLTYNLKDFFVCAVAKLNGNWYISEESTLFSSVENVQISVGIRF